MLGSYILTITVQLINTQSLTDKDYSYEVVDGGKISVTVSGPKSVVTDLKTSDISATADLSKALCINKLYSYITECITRVRIIYINNNCP